MSLLYGQTDYKEIQPGVLQIKRKYLQEETLVIINTSDAKITTPIVDKNYSVLIGQANLQPGQLQIGAKSSVAFGN